MAAIRNPACSGKYLRPHRRVLAKRAHVALLLVGQPPERDDPPDGPGLIDDLQDGSPSQPCCARPAGIVPAGQP